ncbi:hypothetical protein E2C01_076478 [Portunus trituberculatus]|uniref:Uncharacterized protein n=1 Tax=Portunus trituberculatus TaxID=210409 RepID=A0A5B7IDB3_PORTR|nr:hypothetical protein [Portunus trituberculatus]
MTQSTHAPFSM